MLKLSERFPEVSISHHEVIISHVVHVFMIEVQNEKLLNEFWKRIRDYIAVYFQNTMESDFERWNLYLLFVCPERVEKPLKYKIENDRVSSRKIVVDNFKEEVNEEAISLLIKRYINYSFSLPDGNRELHNSYISNSVVYQLITEGKVSNFKNPDKEINRLYSRIKDQLS